MYYNDYEDYMRNVLGYSNTNDNTYCGSCNYGMNFNEMDYNNYDYRNSSTSNIERMYPEIYKIINPMVCRMCDNNAQPVTEYLIEQMTDDIYDNVVNRVEVQNIINLNIGTREADGTTTSVEENRGGASNAGKTTNLSNVSNKNNLNATANSKQNDSANMSSSRTVDMEERETRSPNQRRRNKLLRDLIRILILNRIVRPGRPRPNRPPYRPGPGQRPIGPRPPMPRYDDYEW